MLARFSVSNYRNFHREVTLDLERHRDYSFNSGFVTDGVVSNAIVIGANATGKTNLLKAISDISMNYYPSRFLNAIGDRDSVFINADSAEPIAHFGYEYHLAGHSVLYTYDKDSDMRLGRETLKIDDELIFDYCNPEGRLLDSNLKLIGAESLNWEFTGDYASAIAYLTSNAAIERGGVLSEFRRASSQIVTLLHEGSSAAVVSARWLKEVIRDNRVVELEHFLSHFGISEHLVVHEDADGSKSLYCKHETRDIPFIQCMSSGTRTLLAIFYAYELAPSAALYLLDEFDAYCHYELAERLVSYFGSKRGCQTIVTTHNTSLTKNSVMRPDCVFMLGGDGRLASLAERTSRELRFGNNVEKLLRNGEFE